MRIHLNIGSNQGDRKAIIGRAAALIARALAPCTLYLSDYVESEPWGYDSPHTFLNRGILVITRHTIAPADVLDATQHIEQLIGASTPHRNPDGSYRDRLIDIDIIDIDHITLDTPRLTLPHPRAHLRPFVTGPMRQLDDTHPVQVVSHI
ncbi:MAG: 2-amino-4-hydroxy-6-hydroxymethyldihydropteridine diphosphokinase [Bacteroidales bacterium]|nr:2-amino-4-hydroxy-6-hydroxymethyldihydropteridine diphosphokinase [Bacteroidales bacterium]